MDRSLEKLLDSLLYEGYALYPYTPGATKNATPTPFGIVYPPAYAGRSDATYDLLRMECVVETAGDAVLRGEVRFLQAEGERHKGVERRVEIPATGVADLEAEGTGQEFGFDAAVRLEGRVRMRATTLGSGLTRIAVCVHNTTPVEGDRVTDRTSALSASLISTHTVAEIEGGRFISPLEREGVAGEAVAACRNLNTWPVLASPRDDAVLERRSTFRTTRRWLRRAWGTSSTRPRSRRRCCCTSTRSRTTSGERSPSRTPR